MVQFFDLPGSRSSLLGSQIGGAVGKGIAGGLKQALTAVKQKDLLPTVSKTLKMSKLDTTTDDSHKIYRRANEYRKQGLNDTEASFQAVQDFEKGLLQDYGVTPAQKQVKEEEKAGVVGKQPQAEHHRGLKNFDYKKTPIETLPYKDLFQLSSLFCDDLIS